MFSATFDGRDCADRPGLIAPEYEHAQAGGRMCPNSWPDKNHTWPYDQAGGTGGGPWVTSTATPPPTTDAAATRTATMRQGRTEHDHGRATMARAISPVTLAIELTPDADELAFLAAAAFANSVSDEAAALMGGNAWYGLSLALQRISEHIRNIVNQPGGEQEVTAD